MLKSTTRHIHIFAAEVREDENELIPNDRVLTLDVDPDNELSWNDDALEKVRGKFRELVESYNGEDLLEYNIRRIGSDLEHYVQSLLFDGELSYNLSGRVLNYSLGLPRVAENENKLKQGEIVQDDDEDEGE
jgi:NAD(P)H-quinone oxidoreductase subunit M